MRAVRRADRECGLQSVRTPGTDCPVGDGPRARVDRLIIQWPIVAARGRPTEMMRTGTFSCASMNPRYFRTASGRALLPFRAVAIHAGPLRSGHPLNSRSIGSHRDRVLMLAGNSLIVSP